MKIYSCISEMYPPGAPLSSFTTVVDNSSRVTEASANRPIGLQVVCGARPIPIIRFGLWVRQRMKIIYLHFLSNPNRTIGRAPQTTRMLCYNNGVSSVERQKMFRSIRHIKKFHKVPELFPQM